MFSDAALMKIVKKKTFEVVDYLLLFEVKDSIAELQDMLDLFS